jgi:hypothetical protein
MRVKRRQRYLQKIRNLLQSSRRWPIPTRMRMRMTIQTFKGKPNRSSQQAIIKHLKRRRNVTGRDSRRSREREN